MSDTELPHAPDGTPLSEYEQDLLREDYAKWMDSNPDKKMTLRQYAAAFFFGSACPSPVDSNSSSNNNLYPSLKTSFPTAQTMIADEVDDAAAAPASLLSTGDTFSPAGLPVVEAQRQIANQLPVLRAGDSMPMLSPNIGCGSCHAHETDSDKEDKKRDRTTQKAAAIGMPELVPIGTRQSMPVGMPALIPLQSKAENLPVGMPALVPLKSKADNLPVGMPALVPLKSKANNLPVGMPALVPFGQATKPRGLQHTDVQDMIRSAHSIGASIFAEPARAPRAQAQTSRGLSATDRAMLQHSYETLHKNFLAERTPRSTQEIVGSPANFAAFVSELRGAAAGVEMDDASRAQAACSKYINGARVASAVREGDSSVLRASFLASASLFAGIAHANSYSEDVRGALSHIGTPLYFTLFLSTPKAWVMFAKEIVGNDKTANPRQIEANAKAGMQGVVKRVNTFRKNLNEWGWVAKEILQKAGDSFLDKMLASPPLVADAALWLRALHKFMDEISPRFNFYPGERGQGKLALDGSLAAKVATGLEIIVRKSSESEPSGASPLVMFVTKMEKKLTSSTNRARVVHLLYATIVSAVWLMVEVQERIPDDMATKRQKSVLKGARDVFERMSEKLEDYPY